MRATDVLLAMDVHHVSEPDRAPRYQQYWPEGTEFSRNDLDVTQLILADDSHEYHETMLGAAATALNLDGSIETVHFDDAVSYFVARRALEDEIEQMYEYHTTVLLGRRIPGGVNNPNIVALRAFNDAVLDHQIRSRQIWVRQVALAQRCVDAFVAARRRALVRGATDAWRHRLPKYEIYCARLVHDLLVERAREAAVKDEVPIGPAYTTVARAVCRAQLRGNVAPKIRHAVLLLLRDCWRVGASAAAPIPVQARPATVLYDDDEDNSVVHAFGMEIDILDPGNAA